MSDDKVDNGKKEVWVPFVPKECTPMIREDSQTPEDAALQKAIKQADTHSTYRKVEALNETLQYKLEKAKAALEAVEKVNAYKSRQIESYSMLEAHNIRLQHKLEEQSVALEAAIKYQEQTEDVARRLESANEKLQTSNAELRIWWSRAASKNASLRTRINKLTSKKDAYRKDVLNAIKLLNNSPHIRTDFHLDKKNGSVSKIIQDIISETEAQEAVIKDAFETIHRISRQWNGECKKCQQKRFEHHGDILNAIKLIDNAPYVDAHPDMENWSVSKIVECILVEIVAQETLIKEAFAAIRTMQRLQNEGSDE